MNHDDTDPIDRPQYSAIERHMRRFVVPEPAAYDPNKRLDVIHEPGLDLRWGGLSVNSGAGTDRK
jgi:hypothetical protein